MNEKGPFAATTLLSLIRDHPSWCDAPGDPDPDCRMALAARSTTASRLLVKRDGADMSQWRWGAEHMALLRAPGLQPCPAPRPAERPQRRLERRLLHARSGRRLRGARGHAFRPHARRRVSRPL